jgi:hypothetical protein
VKNVTETCYLSLLSFSNEQVGMKSARSGD